MSTSTRTSAASPAVSPSASRTTASATPTPTPAPAPSKPLAKARKVYWESLKPGMCVVVPDGDTAFNLKVTDCRAAHDAEVTRRTTLPDAKAWPGDDAIDASATTICTAALSRYVGMPFDESRLDFDFFTTERDGWEDGDRRLICMVFDPGTETTTMTLKGSKL